MSILNGHFVKRVLCPQCNTWVPWHPSFGPMPTDPQSTNPEDQRALTEWQRSYEALLRGECPDHGTAATAVKAQLEEEGP